MQIVVTNTGTEDFPLVDISKLTFTVEQCHSMPKRARWHKQHDDVAEISPSGTSDDEEGSHSDNDEGIRRKFR
jgi:hypothetical protein